MDLRTRELKRLPPRQPLITLKSLVDDFQWRFPRERRDTVLTVCEGAGSLHEAIWAATDSIKADGKMHNHQVKVRKTSRDKLGEVLCGNKPALHKCRRFHDLWLAVKQSAPWGIGPLTVYDVATRIGAYLGVQPSRLYLHTGVRAGLIALADASGQGDALRYKKSQWLLRDELPADFGRFLTMDETEDFLCTYRSMYDELVDFKL